MKTNNGLRFFWKLTSECPFKCPYCADSHKWGINKMLTTRLSADEWMFYWRLIYDKYGACKIILGEDPLHYPGFGEIINRLQEIHYPIHIFTALSVDIDFIIKSFDPKKVKIHACFHPLFMSSEEFLGRLLPLKLAQFDTSTSVVAYPLYSEDVPFYVNLFRKRARNQYLKVDPFVGEYAGRRYPESYGPRIRQYLDLSGNLEDDGKF